ncbi:polysaccharide deacetylase [Acidobacteria bacterium Mor1]|nr:polysaccharide deacetylase [Acidobacteria bacterium Mor1]
MNTASLSLDLDNLWSYMKTHGDAGWERYPSYLDRMVPLALRCLEERDLQITFFIVGLDASLAQNHQALRSIVEAGHEVGNHSFHHEPWLHLYDDSRLEDELSRAENAIVTATGVRPDGFRGPGFSLSETTLRVLARRGYRYDASTFPTYLGPLARAYYFWTAKLDAEEKKRRAKLFGSVKDGLRPLKPYRWELGERRMLEIPVTTMPVSKAPFHVSYLLFLSMRSHLAACAYFRLALGMCRLTGVQPSLLLHPLDFLGGDDCPELAFFPAMGVDGEAKRRWTGDYLDIYRKAFHVVPMGKHADLLADASLPLRKPDFPREDETATPPTEPAPQT